MFFLQTFKMHCALLSFHIVPVFKYEQNTLISLLNMSDLFWRASRSLSVCWVWQAPRPPGRPSCWRSPSSACWPGPQCPARTRKSSPIWADEEKLAVLLNPDPDSQAVLRIRIRINNWLEAESGMMQIRIQQKLLKPEIKFIFKPNLNDYL